MGSRVGGKGKAQSMGGVGLPTVPPVASSDFRTGARHAPVFREPGRNIIASLSSLHSPLPKLSRRKKELSAVACRQRSPE